MARAGKNPEEDRAPRPDARLVLALRCRQDHAVAHAAQGRPQLELSVSVTTRPKRRGEIDGRDYHFIDLARFDEMVRAGELLEWAEVFGYCYGTPRRPVEKALQAGRDVLFDIDWQGTQQLREKARNDLVSVFILPPSGQGVGTPAQAPRPRQHDVIGSRMAKASGEMSHWPEYDYVIVNRDKDQAFAEVRGDPCARNGSSASGRWAFPISCVRCRQSCKALALFSAGAFPIEFKPPGRCGRRHGRRANRRAPPALELAAGRGSELA